jgi:hypothetical protein
VYDFHEFGVTEPEFALFIRDVDAIIKSGKKPVIRVEASASKVPSTRFKSNEDWWPTEIKRRMIKSVMNWRNTNARKEKTYTFGEPTNLVQGKEYANDAKKNRLIYEQFQYIKVRVQGDSFLNQCFFNRMNAH